MRDPIEKMVGFLRDEKRREAGRRARAEWAGRVPVLLPHVSEVVRTFTAGLAEPGASELLSVLANPKHASPLVIAFRRRSYGEPAQDEAGASAVFRCTEDGIVLGYRYPFHGLHKDVRAKVFADLGEPAAVQGAALAGAVADFLVWASVGGGCGGRKLRFGAAFGETEEPAPPDLRIVAA
jgi:hypothetical protein